MILLLHCPPHQLPQRPPPIPSFVSSEPFELWADVHLLRLLVHRQQRPLPRHRQQRPLPRHRPQRPPSSDVVALEVESVVPAEAVLAALATTVVAGAVVAVAAVVAGTAKAPEAVAEVATALPSRPQPQI